MPEIVNLERANNGGFLWPPIADAVDTFLRRRVTDADPYERIWRLIHVWEATEITLAVVAIARLVSEPASDLFKRIREFFYGQAWDQIARAFRESQGASEGSIDQWINILDEIAKAPPLQGRFLLSLQEYLEKDGIDLTALARSWARACDVPPDVNKGTFKVRVAMRHVNSFRNRLAHVPFPHDPLAELADALESATEQLFGVIPVPASHEIDGRSSPLTGAFRSGRCILHGTQFEPAVEPSGPGILFSFPCKRRGDGIETWTADQFVHIDAMMRPHLLTRVKDLDVCEYTRFRAEANAITWTETSISQLLPRPSVAEYIEQDQPNAAPEPTMGEALEAIRSEDFARALALFEQMVIKRPDYHLAWLRLGHIRREEGIRLSDFDRDGAMRLFRASEEALTKALGHRDHEYQAVAHYELSKTLYRIAQLEPHESEIRRRSEEEALTAATMSNDKRFQSWYERLEQFASVRNARPQGGPLASG